MAHIQRLVSKRTKKISFKVYIKTPLKTLTKTFKKKSEAVSYARGIEGNSDILDLIIHPVLNQTFSQSLNLFIPTGKDTGIHSRLKFFDDRIGHLKLHLIKSTHIKRILDEISLTKAPATRNRHLSDFGSFCKWITQESGITYNPHQPVAKATETPGRKEYLTHQQQRELLTICKQIDADETPYQSSPTKKLYLYVLIALTTGMRAGEVKALEWRDIHWKDKIAIIRGEDIGAGKTGGREVPLSQIVIDELNIHRDISLKGLIFPSIEKPEKAYIFRKQWLKAKKIAGLSDAFVFHSLRHTCASNLAMAGKSLMQIGTILGHRSAQTTLRYAHLVERKQLHAITDQAMAHLG